MIKEELIVDFSSLVLMERDADSKLFTKELGSYEVSEGAKFITKMYCENNIVNIFFETDRDVEEWEFSAIFGLFEADAFTEKGYDIENIEDEYNPSWVIKFKYDSQHEVTEEKVQEVCDLIYDKMKKVYTDIEGKKEEYI